eukprot:763665-Prymnesium_polylepis.1
MSNLYTASANEHQDPLFVNLVNHQTAKGSLVSRAGRAGAGSSSLNGSFKSSGAPNPINAGDASPTIVNRSLRRESDVRRGVLREGGAASPPRAS